jgi:hypothetical protein
MNAHNQTSDGRWVEDRLATLDLPAAWRPDTARGLELFSRVRSATIQRRTTRLRVLISAVMLLLALRAYPSASLFERRCINAAFTDANIVVKFLRGLWAYLH